MLHVQLFLHCDVAYALWSAIFTRFGLSWVMPRRVFDLYCWWTSGRPRSAAIWKLVLTNILWCVWTERNNRCFEDLERFLKDILASSFSFFLFFYYYFFYTMYLWTVAFVSALSFSFGKFLVRFFIFS
jgi:hypothetical protein